jgi:hypothetical protein
VRKSGLVLAVTLSLVASGCSKGVSGSYVCTGIPDITSLTLEAGGSYTSNGNILGHATPGSGTYTFDAHRLTLEGSYGVDGLTLTEPNKVIFDRQTNGDLKSLLSSCKKQ